MQCVALHAQVFSKRGYDVAAVNFRGCSGELGAQPLGYHLGFTDDLRFVLQEVMLYSSSSRCVQSWTSSVV
jgi:predicted alpha/beta-fold hydrolase